VHLGSKIDIHLSKIQWTYLNLNRLLNYFKYFIVQLTQNKFDYTYFDTIATSD